VTEGESPIAVAKELRDIIGQIGRDLETTRTYGRKTRRLSVALVISVAADIVLSLLLGYTVLREHQNSDAIRTSQIRACSIGNDGRAAQRRLWDHVLTVSSAPNPGETAAQRTVRLRQLHDFRLFINREFRPVDCVKLYSTHTAVNQAQRVMLSP
jgi:hypothetical protein